MINPDLPITKSSEDKLNRETFAKSLANVLLQSSFPTLNLMFILTKL